MLTQYKERSSVKYKALVLLLAFIFLFNDLAFSFQPDGRLAQSTLAPQSLIATKTFQEDAALLYIKGEIGKFLKDVSRLLSSGMTEEGIPDRFKEFKEKILKDSVRMNLSRLRLKEMYMDGYSIYLPHVDKDGQIVALPFKPAEHFGVGAARLNEDSFNNKIKIKPDSRTARHPKVRVYAKGALSLSVEDEVLYHRILKGDLGDSETMAELTKRSGGRVYISQLEIDHPEEGRTVYLRLNRPIPTIIKGEEVMLRVLRFKGVRPRVSKTGNLKRYLVGDGYVSNISEPDRNGYIRRVPTEISIMGGANADEIKNELAMMKEGIRPQSAFLTDYPVGWGIMKFGNQKNYFLIAGITGDDDTRFYSSSRQVGKVSMRTGRVKEMTRHEIHAAYRAIGKTIRSYHDSGYIHHFPHAMNMGYYRDTATGKTAIILRDLGATEKISKNSSAVSGVEYNARLRALEMLYIIGHCNIFPSLSYDRRGYSRNDRNNMLRSFLKSYFNEFKKRDMLPILRETEEPNFANLYVGPPTESDPINFPLTNAEEIRVKMPKKVKMRNPYHYLMEALLSIEILRDTSSVPSEAFLRRHEYPRDGDGDKYMPDADNTSSVFSNTCVSIDLMNLGPVSISEEVLRRMRLLKQLGVGMIYFYAGYQPSASSKKVHYTPEPTDKERFVHVGNVWIRIASYKTGLLRFGNVQYDDSPGNPFSTTGEWQEGLDFKGYAAQAHQPVDGRKMSVIVDLIPRFPPEAIDETNYKWTYYKDEKLYVKWNEEYRKVDEAEKEERIKDLLRSNPGWCAVKIKEAGIERIILVHHEYFGNNVDQVELNPEVKGVQDFFIEFAKRKIDEGADGFRVDLLHLLDKPNIQAKEEQPIYKIIHAIKEYNPDAFFVSETYEYEPRWDTGTQDRMLQLGADIVYSNRFFKAAIEIARNGRSAQTLNSAVGATLFGNLPLLFYLSNYDQISLKAIGGSPQALMMLCLAVSHLRPHAKDSPETLIQKPMTFMIDWDDLFLIWGKAVRIPGGGPGNDATNPDSHLFPKDPIVDLSIPGSGDFWKSAGVGVFEDFAKACGTSGSLKETYIDEIGQGGPKNQEPDRFYTFSWRKDHWYSLTVDTKPSQEEKAIWVRFPTEALKGKALNDYEAVDLLEPDTKYALNIINGVPQIAGVRFLPGGKPYRILSLRLRSNAAAAPSEAFLRRHEYPKDGDGDKYMSDDSNAAERQRIEEAAELCRRILVQDSEESDREYACWDFGPMLYLILKDIGIEAELIPVVYKKTSSIGHYVHWCVKIVGSKAYADAFPDSSEIFGTEERGEALVLYPGDKFYDAYDNSYKESTANGFPGVPPNMGIIRGLKKNNSHLAKEVEKFISRFSTSAPEAEQPKPSLSTSSAPESPRVAEQEEKPRAETKTFSNKPKLNKQAEKYLIKGSRYYNEGNYTAAVKMFKKSLQYDQNNVSALIYISNALLNLGRYEEVFKYAAKCFVAIGKEKDGGKIYDARSKGKILCVASHAFIGIKEFNSAVEASQNALKLDQQEPHYRRHLANAYLKWGLALSEPEPAIRMLQNAGLHADKAITDIANGHSFEAREKIIAECMSIKRLASHRINELSRAKKEPIKINKERERRIAADFRNTLIAMADAAKEKGETIILGLDESWIPKGAGATPLIREIENMPVNLKARGLDNVIFKRGRGDEVALAIQDEQKKSNAKFSNIIVIGEKGILGSNEFGKLKGMTEEDAALLVGVDSVSLQYTSGVRILEMYLLAMAINLGKDPSELDQTFISIGVTNGRRAFIFTPIKLHDLNDFKKIYELQIKQVDINA